MDLWLLGKVAAAVVVTAVVFWGLVIASAKDVPDDLGEEGRVRRRRRKGSPTDDEEAA